MNTLKYIVFLLYAFFPIYIYKKFLKYYRRADNVERIEP